MYIMRPGQVCCLGKCVLTAQGQCFIICNMNQYTIFYHIILYHIILRYCYEDIKGWWINATKPPFWEWLRSNLFRFGGWTIIVCPTSYTVYIYITVIITIYQYIYIHIHVYTQNHPEDEMVFVNHSILLSLLRHFHIYSRNIYANGIQAIS